MIIVSFTALAILAVFVLPGFWTRALISRKIALPQPDNLQLLLQCVLISFALDMAVWLLWLVLARWVPPPLTVIERAVSARLTTSPGDLAVLLLAVALTFGLGMAVALLPCPGGHRLLAHLMTLGGTLRATPLAYFLYAEFPALLREGALPEYFPWVDVICTDGSRIVGRVYQYGIYGTDQHDLVLAEAQIIPVREDPSAAIGFVYLPASHIVRMVIAYTNNPEGTPRIPWESHGHT